MLEIEVSRMLYRPAGSLVSMPSHSERVREAIEAAARNGYTVADVAKACGISAQSVYQWLDGTTKELTGPNAAELSALSGYRALWITKEKGQKFDSRPIQQAVKLMEQMTPERQADAVKIIAPLVEQNVDDAKTG